VLGVDEAGRSAGLLGLSDDGQGEGGLAGAVRAVDFGDPASGHAAHADGLVEGGAASGDGGHGRRPIGMAGHVGAEAVAELPEGGTKDGIVGCLVGW
jgi:hypothetical protein